MSKHPRSIIKEGTVTKQGGRIKTWKKRWCVLDDHGLSYYKLQDNPSDRYENLQGEIELTSIEAVEELTEKIKKRYCFKVVTPQRTYVIDAEAPNEMHSWISQIKKIKEKGSSSPSVSRGQKEEHRSELSSKSAEELESMISALDSKMRNEVNDFVASCQAEVEAIIDELSTREINQVKTKYEPQRQAIAAELKQRQ